MAKYDVGDMIRDARKRLGVTQEELAYGICTPSTLSKIENKQQVPNRHTFEALMQRLGEPGYLYSIYTSSEDLKQHKLCRRIIRMLANYDMTAMKSLLEEYRDIINQKDVLEKQFFLYTMAIYHARLGMDAAYVLQELEEALLITRQSSICEKGPKAQYLLTFDEIVIWNNIAIQNYRIGKRVKGYGILEELKEYLEKDNVDEEAKAGVYPMILCNLAGWLLEMRCGQEALELCNTGVEFCLSCGRLIVLPYLLQKKSDCLEHLNQHQEAQEYLEYAQNIFVIMKNHTEMIYREIEIAL